MKEKQILGNIWAVVCEAQLVEHYGTLQVVLYLDDEDDGGYWILGVDEDDNVFIKSWTNGTPARWVNTEWYESRKDTVGALLFWEAQILREMDS